MDNFDKVFKGFSFTFFLILFLNIAWIGTLIWGIIFILTHISEWIS